MSEFKYQRIADTLSERIAAGAYPDGRLPTIQEIREEFGASYGSVRGAFLILKTQGIIVGRQGQGVFVAE